MPNPRALIIDDNQTNILVLQQLLTMEGLTTFTMSNAKQLAFHLDSIKNIDVVFLDLEMPVVDGYAAVKVIKNHPNFLNTKVVAYSVHVSELHNAFEMGFDGFLGKPLNAEAFPEQLENILKGERVNYLP